jgi:IS4 transposase
LLIRRACNLYSDTDLVGLDLKNTVYALDATTIDLCLSQFNWAPFRKSKAAVKLHKLLDLRGAIRAFIHISDGKMHDVNVLDFMPIEARAFYVMDRGYLDYTRLYAMHRACGLFVTRAKVNMGTRRIYSKRTDRTAGVICDQKVLLKGIYASQNYPESLRRIRFKDPDTGKTLIFLTNNFVLPPLTAALYKNRWQVELFFKWIKQHLRIKKFLGNSENAVKAQIWCTVSTYVLIAIVKMEPQIDALSYTLLQMLSVSVFKKTELSSAF